MEGWVPDSSKYVPGRGANHFRDVVAPAATSVENDCTRAPWGRGTKVGSPAAPAAGQVSVPGVCVGLGAVFRSARSPRPPPNWPTITIEVGIFPPANDKLLVRLICRSWPEGTVMITGDHAPLPSAPQLANELGTAVPQLYPHMGTLLPSGMTRLDGPAPRLTCCWARARLAPRRRTIDMPTALFRLDLTKWNRIALLLT